jgi:hypothetical protein
LVGHYFSLLFNLSFSQIKCDILPEIELGEVDQPFWYTKSGVFSYAETWEKLREKQPIVPWYKVVWFPAAIPRHSFVLWLVFKEAIVTRKG